jgi:uncharacterized membrane protein
VSKRITKKRKISNSPLTEEVPQLFTISCDILPVALHRWIVVIIIVAVIALFSMGFMVVVAAVTIVSADFFNGYSITLKQATFSIFDPRYDGGGRWNVARNPFTFLAPFTL